MKKLTINELKSVKAGCGDLCGCMIAFLDVGNTWEAAWTICKKQLDLPR